MPARECPICGRHITATFSICAYCEGGIGKDRTAWPPWALALVRDADKYHQRATRADHSVYREVPLSLARGVGDDGPLDEFEEAGEIVQRPPERRDDFQAVSVTVQNGATGANWGRDGSPGGLPRAMHRLVRAYQAGLYAESGMLWAPYGDAELDNRAYRKAHHLSREKAPPMPTLAPADRSQELADFLPVIARECTQRQREALGLYLQGFTHAEIAAKLGVSPGAITRRLQNAVGRLQDWQRRELGKFA